MSRWSATSTPAEPPFHERRQPAPTDPVATHPTSVDGHAITWSIAVVDLDSGQPLLTHDAERVLPTASMGKVLLLLEVFRQAEADRIDPAAPLPIAPAHEVADSGLLHLFRDRTVTVEDACLLVAAVSDNLATNALADLCGLDAVRATGGGLGLTQTAFLDVIRDERGPRHPWAPSCGTARELARLFALLHAGEAVSPTVSERVLADAGIVTGPAAALSYAVLAQWSPAADTGPGPVRVAVEDHMRAVGTAMLAHLLDD
jgi:beta-lactamase class A